MTSRTPPRILTLTLLAGLSSFALSLMLPALPAMAAWFETDVGTMQLAVSVYLALSAALQIVIGPLSDRYGRRKVLIWSLVLFLIATAGTLAAPNATVFLTCRMAQAVIASGIIIMNLFSKMGSEASEEAAPAAPAAAMDKNIAN